MLIGSIGTGLLGSAMAARFLARGIKVVAYDPDETALQNAVAEGVAPARCNAEVAERCRTVILSLPNSAISAAVVEEIRRQLAPGTLVIDTTTGSPEDMANLADRLASSGVHYVDATIGGNSTQARAGDVIALAGGAPEAETMARPVLEVVARKVFWLGPSGAGARMKLVLNLALGLNRAVLAEALHFAAASGFQPAQALAVLKEGPSYSRAMDIKGERMLRREYPPEARLSQHLKDVRLILKEGRRLGAPMPLTAAHKDLLETAESLGFGAADNSAVLEAYYTAGK